MTATSTQPLLLRESDVVTLVGRTRCAATTSAAAADPAGSGKLVESRGVEALHVSTGETASTNPGQPPRQQNPLGEVTDIWRSMVDRSLVDLHIAASDLRDRLDRQAPDGMAKLRAAAAEALLAAGLVMAEIEGERRRQHWEEKPGSQRLLKAMEQLREALS